MHTRRGRIASNKHEEYKNIKIYICSWNVNTIQPLFDLENLLKFQDDAPDICVFGFQEVNSKPLQRILDYFYNDPWTNELTHLLSKLGYVRIKTTRLVGIILNIFVRRELLTHVRYSIENWVRLGCFGFWGNKGANICTLNIGGLNLCFINSHLSAHEYQRSKRQEEYLAILANQKTIISNNLEKIILKDDYQFIFGDLNFRIEGLPIDYVKELIQKKEYERLLDFDQLRNSMNQQECFKKYKEKQIDFPPTYKFDQNTNRYDTSTKKRVPSWCDRILHKTDTKDKAFINCDQLSYNHIPEYNQSDHKPVFALFQVKVGNFELQKPDITFTKILQQNTNIEINYEISANIVTHNCDWIGFFKDNFQSTDDYITYLYPERIFEFENKKVSKDLSGSNIVDLSVVKKKAILQANYLQGPGNYIVAYFSYVSKHLIGVSETFEFRGF